MIITFATKIFAMKKFPFFLLILMFSCAGSKVNVSNAGKENVVVDGKIYSTAYQQKAAEYRALCLQAYNIAHTRVDEIALTKFEKPKVIITDIDETILDNSPYEVHQTLQGKDYEATSWDEWTAMANADTVPGAASFLKYASSKGLEIFYITNRSENERAATLKNLQKFNLPNTDNAHLFLRQTTSSKEERRQNIAATHSIIMLLGDNLGDFSFLFDKKTIDERSKNVDMVSNDFGNKFIVLPNPVYGDWEFSLYNYNFSLTQLQKDSAIRASLHGY